MAPSETFVLPQSNTLSGNTTHTCWTGIIWIKHPTHTILKIKINIMFSGIIVRRKTSVPVQDTQSTVGLDTHTQTRHRRAMLTSSGETLRRPEVVGGSIQVCLDLIHLHFKSIKWQILFCLSLVLFEISFHSLKSCYLELSGIFVPNRSNLCSEVPMSDHFCV